MIKNPIEIDDLGVPPFQETTIYIYIFIYLFIYPFSQDTMLKAAADKATVTAEKRDEIPEDAALADPANEMGGGEAEDEGEEEEADILDDIVEDRVQSISHEWLYSK